MTRIIKYFYFRYDIKRDIRDFFYIKNVQNRNR